MLPPGADFAEQAAARIQMVGGFGQNAPHEVEPVLAAEMRHDRLMGIFGREGLDFGLPPHRAGWR